MTKQVTDTSGPEHWHFLAKPDEKGTIQTIQDEIRKNMAHPLHLACHAVSPSEGESPSGWQGLSSSGREGAHVELREASSDLFEGAADGEPVTCSVRAWIPERFCNVEVTTEGEGRWNPLVVHHPTRALSLRPCICSSLQQSALACLFV